MKITNLVGKGEQTKTGVFVMDTPFLRELLLNYLLTYRPLTAIDTETVGVNPREETAVGKGRIVCWSLAFQSGDDVYRFFLWWDNSLNEWLEDETCPKIGYNFYTFDKFVFRNMGVEVRGVVSDTLAKARLWKSNKMFNVGLKSMMKLLLGYHDEKFSKLFSRPTPGKIETRKKLGKSYRKLNGVKIPTVLGLESQKVSFKTQQLIPLDTILKNYPDRLTRLYDYASLDAKANLEVELSIRDKIPPMYSFWHEGLETWSEMMGRGIAVDVPRIKRTITQAENLAEKELSKLNSWKEGINWSSPKQLSEFLYGFKNFPIPPVMGGIKALKKNWERKPSTSEASLLWLEGNVNDKNLSSIITYRNRLADIAKLKSYLKHERNGRVYPSSSPSTDTGRLAVKKPALQQVNANDKDVLGIRKCFISSPGHVLVVADYSQLELYVLAHFMISWFSDYRLYEALTSSDVHSHIARLAWPFLEKYPGNLKQYGEKIKKYRDNVKSIVYGMIYGKSASGLGISIKDESGMAIGKEKAQEFLDLITSALGFDRYVWKVVFDCRQKGYVETISGRRRYLPGINSNDRYEASSCERQAMNTPVQGSAAGIVTMAASRLRMPLVLQVHDELILEVPEDKVNFAKEHLIECMEKPMFDLQVELKAECSTGKTWAEAK